MLFIRHYTDIVQHNRGQNGVDDGAGLGDSRNGFMTSEPSTTKHNGSDD